MALGRHAYPLRRIDSHRKRGPPCRIILRPHKNETPRSRKRKEERRTAADSSCRRRGLSGGSQGSEKTGKMTRGSQRERDRERAAARKPNAKGSQDGLTPEQRRERDKKALEEKAAKKAQQAAAAAASGGGTSTDSKNKGGKN